MKLSEADQKYLSLSGLEPEEIHRQVDWLKRGPAYLSLVAPCTPEHGIWVLNEDEREHFLARYASDFGGRKITKFVPASGAATRMFHDLIHQVHLAESSPIEEKVEEFFRDLHRFPFWPALREFFSRSGEDLDSLVRGKKYHSILRALLFSPGLNLSHRPKGLVEFHRYGSEARTAFSEHLFESTEYIKDGPLYFTVPEGQLEPFRELWRQEAERFPDYRVEFSFQEAKTHMICLDESGEIHRDDNGTIHLRPGGHGSLLANLSLIDAQMVFIKNIDNVTRQERHAFIGAEQRILGGVLLEIQDHIFQWLEKIESDSLTPADWRVLEGFMLQRLGIAGTREALERNPSERREWLRSRLNRPLRVCGMVPNQGEPGGGPFWVRMADGLLGKQIVEKAQVDPGSETQQRILSGATHFNPVNLVCALKDRHGRSFRLEEFCDTGAYFASTKKMKGKNVRILERPGLWNGAMAHWNTVFVEVPLATFCPVKTVFDLLKSEHQEGPS